MANRYWVGGTATWDGTAGSKWASTSGGAGGQSVPTNGDDVFFDGNSGVGTITVGTGRACRSLNFTGFTGTFAMNNSLETRGDIVLGSGMTFTASSVSNELGLNAQSGAFTITSNGKTIPCSIQVGITGTNTSSYSLVDNFVLTGAFYLNAASFSANNRNVSIGSFTDGGSSNTSALTLGSGVWTVSGGSTAWSNTGSLTPTPGSGYTQFTNSGSGTMTVRSSTAMNVKFTAGTYDLTTSNSTFGNVDFTGFAGTWINGTNTIAGSLTLSTGMSLQSGGGATTFTSTGAASITSNGKSFNCPLTFNGVGGVWTLQDSLTTGTARTTTLTNGTISLGSYTLSTGLFATSNSNTRVLALGTGTLSLTGTGTVWNSGTITGLTVSGTTGKIEVANTSATGKTFAGGGATFTIVVFSGDNITVSGSNTFSTFSVNTAGRTNGLKLTAGTTQTMSAFTTNGSAGNLAKLVSTSAGSAASLSMASGTVSVDYMSIQDSTATGGASWFAGAHSTNVSGNTGWIFTAPPDPPTATTQAVSDILVSIAVGNGNITGDGGSTVLERGIVVSKDPNPTTSSLKFTAAGTTGAYTANISGLEPATTYHVRAYATNIAGTSYGADVEFTTLALPVIDEIDPPGSNLDVATEITIHGSNFREDIEVEIDGELCDDIVVMDAETITCVAPERSTQMETQLVLVSDDPVEVSAPFYYMALVPTPAEPKKVRASFGIEVHGFLE